MQFYITKVAILDLSWSLSYKYHYSTNQISDHLALKHLSQDCRQFSFRARVQQTSASYHKTESSIPSKNLPTLYLCRGNRGIIYWRHLILALYFQVWLNKVNAMAMSFTGSVLSSKWDLVNVSDHFLLPPNKHTPHVACLEVVWYYRRVWEVFTHIIITLHLSTGAYCSSRKPDKTIPNRHSCPLRGFPRRSIQPFNLALSSLPLLFSSLY